MGKPDEESAADHFATIIADEIIQDVAELPYTLDPDSSPDLMLVTAEELRIIVYRAFDAHITRCDQRESAP